MSTTRKTAAPKAATPAKAKPQPATPRQPHVFSLGDVLRCRITGAEGVAVAYTEYLYGCRRWSLQPAALKEGKHDWITFDEPQLERIATAPPAPATRVTGGPRPDTAARPGPDQR